MSNQKFQTVKRSGFITAIAFILGTCISAHAAEQVQQQNQKQTSTQVQLRSKNQLQATDRVQKQKKVQEGNGVQNRLKTNVSKEERKMIKARKKAEKNANHGQNVSETAKSTESGPGKGEIVSTQAKIQGQTQQARIKENNSAKNHSGFHGARSNAVQNRTRVSIRGGAGRK